MGAYRNSIKLAGGFWSEIVPAFERLSQLYLTYQSGQSSLRQREMQLAYEGELEKARKEATKVAAEKVAKVLPAYWVNIVKMSLFVGVIGLIVLIERKSK